MKEENDTSLPLGFRADLCRPGLCCRVMERVPDPSQCVRTFVSVDGDAPDTVFNLCDLIVSEFS